MTAQSFFDTYKGQSLLWNPSPARQPLRGQCVQAVCHYVNNNNKPVIHADAYKWWTTGASFGYQKILNSPTAVPSPGDIIIWGPNLSGSGGAGHIAVCLQPRPGTGTFVSIDQNWSRNKTVHQVVHNYNHVVGWLRFSSPSPAPSQPIATNTGAIEMIANADQAQKMYQLLRPNGTASSFEIGATAGRRSFAAFLNDAQPEVAARNQHIQNLTNQNQAAQATIAQLNQHIARLNDLHATDEADDAQLIKDRDQARAEIAKLTQQLQLNTAKQAVTIEQVQNPATISKPTPKAGLLTNMILFFINRKKK